MKNSPFVQSPSKIIRVEVQRKKVYLLIVAQCCILFTLIFFLFRRKNNFMGAPEDTLIFEKMYKLIDQINNEVEACLKYTGRKRQNDEFSKIDFIPNLRPIRLSEMTAVFELTGNISEYIDIKEGRKKRSTEKENSIDRIIVKRVILKVENKPEEDKISMLVDHPHIVKTYRAHRCTAVNSKGKQQSLLWLFIEPLDIKVSLKENAKKEDEIRAIIKDTLIGLEYMHKNNIAHLDIKLANVMGKRDENNNITYKLIDFGFSRIFSNKKKEIVYPNRCYGTFPYKSPEVWLSSVHGFASDIWCVGAMSLFLANRKSSYFQKKGSTTGDTGTTKDYVEFRQFLEDKTHIRIDSETSPELALFIKLCMMRNRNMRPTASALLKHKFILGEKLDSHQAQDVEYYV